MLIIVCGLPGSGKSRVAKSLARAFNAEHLRTDEIRKLLWKKPKYGKRQKAAVYGRLLDLSEKMLKEGKNVIVDATFYRKIFRENFRRIAERHCVFFEIVETKCKEKVIKERLGKRMINHRRVSDADFLVYKKLRNEWEKIMEKHIVAETSKGSEKAAKKVIKIFEKTKLSQKEIVSRLRQKEAYPHKTKEIEEKQTHISYVFLTGRFAYKVKKDVKFSFLDFSTLIKRKFFCQEELRLNRRTAKEIYICVVPIKFYRGKIKIGGKGKTVEYAVKMKQLNEKSLMINLLKKSKVNVKTIGKICEKIVALHRKASKSKDVLKFGKIKYIWENCAHPFTVEKIAERYLRKGKKVREIKKRMKKFLSENKKLFGERIRKRKIVEGHGDLHSGNIFIETGKVYIFDAIEFSRQIRCIDVINEIAFFLMDLEFNGKKPLADAFLENYLELTSDFEGINLLHFYKCYRAIVRAMVCGYMINDNADKKKEKIKRLCEKYVNLAYKYSEGFK